MNEKEIDANYGPTEDVANSISVRDAQTDLYDIKPESFQLHGPKCGGCENHHKAIMLSYIEHGDRTTYDLFLNGANAKKFLADIKQFYSEGNPVIIAFQNCIDGKSKKFLIEGDHLERLLEGLDYYRDEISLHIKANKALIDQEPIPARRPPPTEDEIEAARKSMDGYYKHEPLNVSLEGIDMGLLLAALYNNAKTGGMGSGHYRDELMTPTEGRHVLNELSRIGALPEIDYINGRSIKCFFGQNEEGLDILSFTRYHDYNDIPSAAIISLARKGVYGTLPGQDGLDVNNEAAILLKALSGKNPLPVDIERLAQNLAEQQTFYLEARRPNSEPIFYQISICGNGRVRGEVGHLIQPYVEDQTPPAAPSFEPR